MRAATTKFFIALKFSLVNFGLLTIFLTFISLVSESHAEEIWSLTNDQRRAFLNYYSPIILKRANENDRGGKNRGHDWITNFDFDRDGDFSNNRQNWHRKKYKYIMGESGMDWRIRPTLYSAIIEFMDEGQKSLILLYHVYHALQEGDIHDWERIEIRLDNIPSIANDLGPGHGEHINYHVLTAHKGHTIRKPKSSDLRYLDSQTTKQRFKGKHLLVWQAKWSHFGYFDGLGIDGPGPYNGELRFVKTDYHKIMQGSARARISDHGEKPFHYIFVSQDADDAVELLGAQQIEKSNAPILASGFDDDKTIPIQEVHRITYELQDLADIVPTHYQHANGLDQNIHWSGRAINIQLTEPITSTFMGTTITVPKGRQTFLANPRDGDKQSKRTGYVHKHWFWGTYFPGKKKAWTKTAYEARDQVWQQHDYFAHRIVNKEISGRWLPPGWHLQSNGGYDGRWIPLFPN